MEQATERLVDDWKKSSRSMANANCVEVAPVSLTSELSEISSS